MASRGLAKELQQCDGESGGADGMSEEYRAEIFVDAHLELAQIRLGSECGLHLVQDLKHSDHESALREDDTDEPPRLTVQRLLEV